MSLKERITLREVFSKDQKFFETLTEKVKKSKTVHSCRGNSTLVLQRTIFKFDTFDIKISTYGKHHIGWPKKYEDRQPGQIKDITVKDKSGKTLAYIDCELSYEGVEKLNSARLKLCEQLLKEMHDKEKAKLLKKEKDKEMRKASKNMGDATKLRQQQYLNESLQMSQALDSIKKL